MSESTSTSGPHPERVPDAEAATADPRKFTHYLLSSTHAVGAAKARVFKDLGYHESNWEELWEQLRSQLPQVPGRFSKENRGGGQNYEVPMKIKATTGMADVQTIWEVHPTTGTTFITAYPL